MKSRRIHYGWVIALAGGGAQSAQALAVYTFGVFLIPLTLEFGWERGALAVAASLAGAEMGFLAIVTGKLSDKYGPRLLVTLSGLILGSTFLLMTRVNELWHVYVFWGIGIGLSASCSVVPILATIPRWFTKKRGIAISIPATGFGLGAVISPLLAQVLISAYGWRQSYLIMAIVAWLIIIPLAQFLRQSPEHIGLKPYGESEALDDKGTREMAEGFSFVESLKTPTFWIFGGIQFFWFYCLQTIVVHITPHAADIGIPEIAAASVLSFMAGSSVVSRFSMGFISDKIGSRRALSLSLILSTLALVWLLFAREIWAFYLFAVVFGLAYGGFIPLLTVVPAELFGVKSLGVILGALMLYSTLGSAGGAPISGYIFDITGSYNTALIITVILCSITAVLGLILLKQKAPKT
jgi:MFS family permease